MFVNSNEIRIIRSGFGLINFQINDEKIIEFKHNKPITFVLMK